MGDTITFEKRVAAGVDDVEQRASGSMYMDSSDLELVDDLGSKDRIGQFVGVRFTGIDIPAGAIITNAYLQFQTDEIRSGATSLLVRGEDADDSAAFAKTDNNVSSRATTDAAAAWTPSAWTIVGEAGLSQRTPDLSAVVQEIVARPGWQAGSDMAFIITGTGTRTAESFEGGAAKAPLLHIEYTLPAADNAAPVLDLDGAADGTGYTATFTENQDAAAVASANTLITDADSASMSKATVALANAQAGDQFVVNTGGLPAGIAVDPASTATSVVLKGSATTADYQAALQQIFFTNTGEAPDPTSRIINITVSDGLTNSTPAVATIAIDRAPDAAGDSVATMPDAAVTTGNVLANDDQGDAPAAITAFDAVSINGGTVASNGDGTFTYTPAIGFMGADSFTYTISDKDGDTSTGTVAVMVSNNHAPTGITLLPGEPFKENVAGAVAGKLNVADPDAGDTHTFAVSDPRFEVVDGELKLKDGIRLDYEKQSQITLDVTATDLAGLSVTQQLAVSVADVEEVRFAAFGDYGKHDATRLVANLVDSLNVDFIITLGDNAYGSAPIDDQIGQYYSSYIGNYVGAYGAGSPVNRFFPALGNHEYSDSATGDASPYLNYFTLPGNERYYDFTIGPVHLFALNSDPHEPDGITSTSVQAEWLQTGLANSTSPYNVVYFHRPPFSSSANHGSASIMQWPFEQWGATAVLSGHDHDYERVLRDDNADGTMMPYFVAGLGGAGKYTFADPPVDGSAARYNADWGTMLVQASEESITFEFISVTGGGTLVDSYTIDLPAGSGAPPLFSAGDDVIDFNQILAGSYRPGSQYNALAGDDAIVLPADEAAAVAAGYSPVLGFHGGDGNDAATGGTLNDTINGDAGDDTLVGAAGIDQLLGGDGHDTLKWDAADKFDGGAGFDTLDADLASGDTIDLRAAGFANMERIRTGDGDDVAIVGLAKVLSETADDQFVADLGGGADILKLDAAGWVATTPAPTPGPTALAAGVSFVGLEAHTFTNGISTVTVFSDAETVQLLAEPKALFTTGGDVVDFSQVTLGSYPAGSQYNALAGNDTVTLPMDAAAAALAGYDPAQAFHGGDGIDTVTGGTLNDTVLGESGADKLAGADGNDTLDGGGSGDTLNGNAGDDTLLGGSSGDTLIGGTGNDMLDGGAGNDKADYSNAAGPVTVDLASGAATGEGDDALLNIENVTGSAFDDAITGNAGVNVLLGGIGNDTLHGGEGNDSLNGGAGVDGLLGDGGTDTLKWDSADTFDGGLGFDTINANLSSADKIDLRGPGFVNVERIQTGSGRDTVTISLSDVLADTADNQFIADLGSSSPDTLNIDLEGGWSAAARNATLGPTAMAAGISVSGMTAYTFTNGADTVTVFSNAEAVNAQ
jgi:Ca2+-binding RTX toxin-like protein